MKQQPKTRRSAAQAQALAALACPACELCAKPTRFVGLESISDNQHADLCTYECNECGHMQANVVTRDESAGVQTGELVAVTPDGAERLHEYERGLLRIG